MREYWEGGGAGGRGGMVGGKSLERQREAEKEQLKHLDFKSKAVTSPAEIKLQNKNINWPMQTHKIGINQTEWLELHHQASKGLDLHRGY